MSVSRPSLWRLAAAYASARRPPFSLRRSTVESCGVTAHRTACPACGGALGYVRPSRQHATGGTAIVLLHGSPGSWKAWAPYLADQNFVAGLSLLAFDRPGYGTSATCTCSRSIATQGACIAAALEEIAPDAALVVVGHSFGGPVALEVARRHHHRVRACVLLAPSLDPSHERALWFQRLAAATLIRTLVPADIRSCNEEILTLREGLQAQAGTLPDLAVPIHCLHGAMDNLVPVENTDYLARMATRARLDIEIISGADHYIPWSHRDRVVDLLQRLAKH